jgi:hypothetical protein
MNYRIEQDDNAQNPRTEFDNIGKMYCWHSRYNLGDKHNYESPEDFQESDEYKNAAVILPLYLYDHSGITISARPFSCPWDSGQVGYIFVDTPTIRKEWGKGKKAIEKARKYLLAEVETYDQYLTGDVWGYIVEDDNGNHLDSCWGFYGEEYCKQEAKSALQYCIKQQRKEKREEKKRLNNLTLITQHPL